MFLSYWKTGFSDFNNWLLAADQVGQLSAFDFIKHVIFFCVQDYRFV